MPSSGRFDGLFRPCAYLLSGEGIIPIPPKGLSLSLVDAVGTGRGDAPLPRQLPCLPERRYKGAYTGSSNCLPLSSSVRKWRNKIPSQLGRVLSQPAAEGTIRPHHDADGAKEMTNSYVEAVKQLAKEEGVLLIDGFEITKSLYEEAWKQSDDNSLARLLMTDGDSTHSSKLGGFISAALFAREIKKAIPELSKALVKPAKVQGLTSEGKSVFMIDSQSRITCANEYWTSYAQKLIDSL